MSENDNGGPAFPILKTDTHDTWPGMTLRDWLAGQALAGFCADPNVTGTAAEIATVAYRMADAMLEARK